jgi:hypothetical protein
MSSTARIDSRGPADLLRLTEAMTLLAFFRVCLLAMPVRSILRAITHGKLPTPQPGTSLLDENELTAARRVQWAVRAAARHSPVEFVCFPQTLAAYVMLRWRGLASTIVYGVARSPGGALLAHTWVEMGEGYVVGGEESEGFSPLERWS